MNQRASNARETLVAELIGDVQELLSRLETADTSTRETACAITAATEQYRAQVNDLVNLLRAETANIILKTTEHAASSLVGQQQQTLQAAATHAMRQAIGVQLIRHTRRDWLIAVALGAAIGASVTASAFGLHALMANT